MKVDKLHLKNKAKKIRKQKYLMRLVILAIIGIIIGILYIAIISKSNKELINSSLNNFFKEISSSKLNYTNALLNSLGSNLIVGILIWLLGISVMGIPIIIGIFLYKSFILGFSISSLIYFYKLKGILIAIIYMIPLIINLLVVIILTYFAIDFSKRLIKAVFYKQELPFKRIIKKYIRILIYSEVILIISSFIEVFLVPSILKLLSIG